MMSFCEQNISKKRFTYGLPMVILVCLLNVAGPVSPTLGVIYVTHGDTQSTSTKAALDWLAVKWQQDGSYGPYSQVSTPGAAYALWLNNSKSQKAQISFTWLASQLDNHSADIGEADISGEILYSLHATGNTGLLHNSSDYKAVLAYQDSSGGFKGYYGTDGQVVSSVDTAFAIWGLISTNSLNDTSLTRATGYLLHLQNPDGSFNLTRTKASLDPFEALGPEPVSTTALVILALKQASFQISDLHISKALGFLAHAASTNFTATQGHQGHVYGASLSAMAFQAYGRTSDLSSAVSFIQSQQNQTDGGFRDAARMSRGSNSLDTGWAAVALQEASQSAQPEQSSSLPGTLLIAAIIVVTVAIIIGALIFFKRSRTKSRVASQTRSE